MKKNDVYVLLGISVVVFSLMAILFTSALKFHRQYTKQMHTLDGLLAAMESGGKPAGPPPGVILPSKSAQNSVAVFNFRSNSAKNTQYLAVGFSRALADKLFCSPTCITNQQTYGVMCDALYSAGAVQRYQPTEAEALKAAVTLGVRYIVVGNFDVSGKQYRLKTIVYKLPRQKVAEWNDSGSVTDLPALQVKLANQLVKTMALQPSASQVSELKKPNFTKLEALANIGHCYDTYDGKTCAPVLWKAYAAEPNSTFVNIKVLEAYVYNWIGRDTLTKDPRFQKVLAKVKANPTANSQEALLLALIDGRQQNYTQAEQILKTLSQQDPGMVRVHTARATVARDVENGELAVQESKKAVTIWPNNSYGHSALAQSCITASDKARRSRYLSKLTKKENDIWSRYCYQGFSEARIATQLNRNSWDGWQALHWTAEQIGETDLMDKAFQEMIRISPCDLNTYLDHAMAYNAQWYQDREKQEKIFKQAEKAFGKDSAEVYRIKAYTIYYNLNDGTNGTPTKQQAERKVCELLQISDKKAKTPDSEDRNMICYLLINQSKFDEAVKVAKASAEQWPTPEWESRYCNALMIQYDHTKNPKALEEQERVSRIYMKTSPKDVSGYVWLADCLIRKGQKKEAIQYLQIAKKLAPKEKAIDELWKQAVGSPSTKAKTK